MQIGMDLGNNGSQVRILQLSRKPVSPGFAYHALQNGCLWSQGPEKTGRLIERHEHRGELFNFQWVQKPFIIIDIEPDKSRLRTIAPYTDSNLIKHTAVVFADVAPSGTQAGDQQNRGLAVGICVATSFVSPQTKCPDPVRFARYHSPAVRFAYVRRLLPAPHSPRR